MSNNILNPISVQTPNTSPTMNTAAPANSARARQLIGGLVGGALNLVAPGAGSAIGSLIGGSGSTIDQTQMMDRMERMNSQSLATQFQMNSESRRFETISNVLKARHDAAMSAVRNIK